MIIEIKLANYRSIHAEQTISFVAEKGTRHPDNLIKRPGYKLMKAAALFGANASGKSNFVRAIGEMAEFVRDSATRYNDGDPIPLFQPFRLDHDSRLNPSGFEITFLTGEKLYRYGFGVSGIGIHYEHLYVQAETAKKETLLFNRDMGYHRTEADWTFGDSLEAVGSLLRERTRTNALALSVGARENVAELIMPYRFFRDFIIILNMAGDTEQVLWHTAGLCNNDAETKRYILMLMRSADIDIDDFDVDQKKVEYADEIAEEMPAELRSFLEWMSRQQPGLMRNNVTAYRNDRAGNRVDFNFKQYESTGTQRLFAIAGPLLSALKTGGFLVIDELDASMHPLLTRRLLELFQSAKANTNGAQMLFTTHDPALFDPVLFRRDQIWLAEKRGGASEFFSLADINPAPRNTEAFLRNYLSGRYGGAPQFSLPLDYALEKARK